MEEKEDDEEEAKGKEERNQGGGGDEDASQGSGRAARRCGNWSGRLKLLRFESRGNRVVLTFSSDYAHGYSGFRARVTALPGEFCCREICMEDEEAGKYMRGWNDKKRSTGVFMYRSIEKKIEER